ncbi:glycoside hydrolase family 3 N-terminal domain-containing protein [Pelosinus sp. sgz500959]|uniref:glycoside hydrolase family 3 protein n=1 Tax=Pelosinus sp. sgz500959 TaxID=3242472 RepID=UPI00367182D3
MYRYFIAICLVFVTFSVGFAQSLVNISEEEELAYRIDQMSLEEKIGQLFMVAFRQENGKPVTTVTREIKAELQKYHLGGIILFGENFVDIEQTVTLTMDLQQAAGTIPLFIAVDQEGGRVNRFHFGTNLPGNMALGASGKVSNAYIAGNILGRELVVLGINTNLAPVLDINSNQDNPVIGIRSFGADGQMVTKMGAAYIQGLHAGGIMAAVKHFPGHGDTSLDSHLGLPSVIYGKSRLSELEIQPFRENLSATDMVVAAHIAFPELDDTKVISKKDGQPVFLPASFSHKILTDLLRESLGYDGVIITDALEMKAITEHFGTEEAVVGAIQAGADILLMPSDLPKAYAGVIEAIKTGVISEERINESVKRILRLKRQWITPKNIPRSMLLAAAQSIVSSKEHKEQERTLAYEAVTLLKNEEGTLPLTVKRDSRIVVAAPRPEILNVMGEAVLTQMKAGGHQKAKITAISYENFGELTADQKKMIDESDTIILATYSSTLASRTPGQTASASFAAALTQYADLSDKKLIVIATGTPYDILYLQRAKAYLAVYGTNSANIQAGMAAIFASINPSGRLPVPIQNQGTILFNIGYGLNN